MSTRKRNAAAYRPRVGELVLDTRTGRTGIYMDTLGGEHYLRPPGGGREWTAPPDRVGPAPDPSPDDPGPAPGPPRPRTAPESRARLSARLAARNQDSRLNESRVA
ncbi:hypothetical protein ACIF6L_16990 [Kitasatospora sp. NPDC086009]|uniref:hypothetical protein n=1 Tax=unclassified Kitasatospora TaxID=2633591 RepID=UPI002E341615|nr:hypothetical protein [Kitasatospora sp. NBC_01246]